MNEHTTVTDDDLWGVPPAPPPPADSPDGEPSKPHRGRKWIAAAAGALAVGVGALVGANIASSGTQNLGTAGPGGFGGPGGRGGGNAGTIASISGSSLKMTTFDGTTVGVTMSASTTVSVSSTGALADVKVGDNVRVNGTLSGTTVAADAITDSGTSPLADLPRGGPGPGGFPGGTGGAPPAGARPDRNPNGAGAATANGAVPPDGDRGFRGGGAGTTGVVKTVGNGTFTVATSDGSTVTVTTAPATTVTLVKPSTVSALKVGDEIQVNGTTRSDGTIAATAIRAGARPVRN